MSSKRKNALLVIHPYLEQRTWVFDDESVGLVKEPFVLGVPEMIEKALKEKAITTPEKGFRMIFSAQSFPSYDFKIQRLREEEGGHWYYREETEQEGWLCPALFCYFDIAPDYLYVKLEGI